jgi:galactokinase
MGDHTDYNGGFVLPMCIPQHTCVALWRRSDRRVRARSSGVDPTFGIFDLDHLEPTGLWLDYVMGVVDSLARENQPFDGFDLRVESTIPVGGGLASSAALQVAMLKAIRESYRLALDDVQLARIARRAENEFIGAPVGIMDQMAATVGSEENALYLDTRSLVFESVPIPATAELVVIDSGIEHNNATSEYLIRRQECEEAAQRLGVPYLTDLSLPEDEGRIGTLPALLERRVRHVVSENERVHATVAALRRGDLDEVGRMFQASHASLRNDFEVSLSVIDELVVAARAEPDVLGARLTGGGFGGCVVAIAKAGSARAAATTMALRVNIAGANATVVLPSA